ncbi:MAG TPA: Gfo/Idh/MocA family oxidoreductase [Pyrinomonadaceae bacterium]|nr:Gfo/Idh/MocA family oxidoreductase [Pyrinomonadaceae bacterium]
MIKSEDESEDEVAERDLIRIGIIGAGFARSTQIPGFRACEGARIVCIASAHREHAESVAREFDIPNVADDWRELVSRDDVDLVSIVTPPVTHVEMTLAALANGKAVLCEKPMAMNAGEAEQMLRSAQSEGALNLIDHELRFLAGRQRMRDGLRQGEIGEVRHAKFLFRADSRADVSRPWNWWSDETQGGGILGAIGSHAVDSFRWLLGAEISGVSGSLATHVTERPEAKTGEMRKVTSDDEALLILRFRDGELTRGATATVSMSMIEQGRAEHRVEIFGTRGALAIEDSGQLWRAETGSGEWKRVETERGPLAEGMRDSGWARGFTSFAPRIVAAMREGRNTVEGAATFEDGYRTQLVLDAARRSHEAGCWTEVTPS